MNQDFLLEIGVEEMPSAFMGQALKDLKEVAGNKLNSQRIEYSQIATFGTPRRLVLFIQGLADQQADALIETKGPKKSSAFAADGEPTRAAQGFARSQGIMVSDLKIQSLDGIEYVFAL
ncbi:MAG: glycine--tRNA ligase subunit beta, partial [Syntrophomonadaceae bacterium]